VETIVNPLSDLIARAERESTQIIYVNDNYGDWNSSQDQLAKQAMEGARPDLVEPILPPDGADFVLKARHTIFYMTPLEYLLGQENIDRVILTGQVTEQCILYSALDAYVRHIQVAVPRDGVAHIHEDLADAALEMMQRNMGADITSCSEI
jgi:nicotinamidase-related amidase